MDPVVLDPARHTVIGIGFEIDAVLILEAEPLHVLFVHQDDHARALHAAKPVVIAIDRRVELIVGPHGEELQHVRRSRIDVGIDVEAFRNQEVRLAGLGPPLASRCPDISVKAARRSHSLIVILEIGRISALDGVPNLGIVADPFVPGDGGLARHGRLGQFRDDLRFGEKLLGRRLARSEGRMDAGRRIFDGDGLFGSVLDMLFEPAEAGQDIGLLRSQQMIAVQLGRDLHIQAHFPPRLLDAPRVRYRAREIAAETDEALHLALEQAFAGLDRVEPLLLRNREAVKFLELFDRDELGLLGDADRSLALDIGMSPDRRNPGPLLAHHAAHEEEVAQHVDILDSVPMLGKAHPIIADDAACLGIDTADMFEIGSGKARASLDLTPVGVSNEALESLEPVAMLFDEIDVEYALNPLGLGLIVQSEDSLGDPGHSRDVAAASQLVVVARHFRALTGREHLHRALRALEPHQPPLLQRVEGDHRRTALSRLLDPMQKTRGVRAGVVAEEEHHVAGVEIGERHGSDRRADRFRQPDRRRLVTHVRRIGEIVRAVDAREELPHMGGFERGPAGDVEDDRSRIEAVQLLGDLGEGVGPFDRDILIERAVIFHGRRQAPLLLEIVVGPFEKVTDTMFGEEVPVATLGRDFPHRRLRAILAIFKGLGIGGLGPGTGHALIAVGLVLVLHRRPDGRGQKPFLSRFLDERFHRTPSAGRLVIGLDLRAIGVLAAVHDISLRRSANRRSMAVAIAARPNPVSAISFETILRAKELHGVRIADEMRHVIYGSSAGPQGAEGGRAAACPWAKRRRIQPSADSRVWRCGERSRCRDGEHGG